MPTYILGLVGVQPYLKTAMRKGGRRAIVVPCHRAESDHCGAGESSAKTRPHLAVTGAYRRPTIDRRPETRVLALRIPLLEPTLHLLDLAPLGLDDTLGEFAYLGVLALL